MLSLSSPRSDYDGDPVQVALLDHGRHVVERDGRQGHLVPLQDLRQTTMYKLRVEALFVGFLTGCA